MDAVAELQALLAQAEAERGQAERRESQVRGLLHRTKKARGLAAARRAELADAFEHAAAAEAAALERLGSARLALATAEREVERLADAAVGGSDPAARALSKSRDVVETTGAVVRAHERRVRELVTARERAEAALAEHDRELAHEVGRELERHLLEVAQDVDRRLGQAVEQALLLGRVVDARRAVLIDGTPPREPWTTPLASPLARYHAAETAFRLAASPLEPTFATHGPTRGGRSMAQAAAAIVDAWMQGRGEFAPPPGQAA
jgi:hypothetical protein